LPVAASSRSSHRARIAPFFSSRCLRALPRVALGLCAPARGLAGAFAPDLSPAPPTSHPDPLARGLAPTEPARFGQ